MQRKKSIAALILASLAAVFLLLGLNEPSPGLHDCFFRLSGDWAVKIGDTGYEIGCSLDSPERKHFRVFHWARHARKDGSKAEGYTPEKLFDPALSYHRLGRHSCPHRQSP